MLAPKQGGRVRASPVAGLRGLLRTRRLEPAAFGAKSLLPSLDGRRRSLRDPLLAEGNGLDEEEGERPPEARESSASGGC